MQRSEPSHHLPQNQHEQGFSLPLALGFGLLILILAQTMLLRAYQQRVTTLSRVAGNDALAIAEIGVTRYQAFLNRYRDLAIYPACAPTRGQQICPPNTWRQAPQLLASKVCQNTDAGLQQQLLQTAASQDTGVWQAIESADPSQGQFRLVSYEYIQNQGMGRLTVEGRTVQTVAATNNRQATQARLQVDIPVTPRRPGQPSLYPGLWLATLETQPTSTLTDTTAALPMTDGAPATPPPPRLSVKGNVFINDCGTNLNTISPNPPNTVASNVVLQTNISIPSLPPLPTVNQPSSGSATPPNPNLPIVYGLGAVTKGMNLPRTRDLPSPNGANQVYRYVIDSLNLPTTSRIRVDVDNQREQFQTSVEVELYVKGALGSLTRIEHDCSSSECHPTDLKVYAYQNADAPNVDGSYPEFCIKENQTFTGFLFAPGYQVGLGNNAKFTGTLWARAWNFNCATNPETTTFTQWGTWGNRQVMLPPQLRAMQRWQRVSLQEQ